MCLGIAGRGEKVGERGVRRSEVSISRTSGEERSERKFRNGGRGEKRMCTGSVGEI